MKFINVARILCEPDIVDLFLSSSVKFLLPMATYNLTPAKSAKFFNLNKFVNNLYFYLFLTNPDSLPWKCNNSLFDKRQHKYIATGNLWIITNNVLKKLFIERPKNIEVMPIILENLSFKY